MNTTPPIRKRFTEWLSEGEPKPAPVEDRPKPAIVPIRIGAKASRKRSLSLPERLREARTLLGLSQSAAARRAGLHQPHLSDLETNEKTHLPVRYLAFLSASGVDLRSLFAANPHTALPQHAPPDAPPASCIVDRLGVLMAHYGLNPNRLSVECGLKPAAVHKALSAGRGLHSDTISAVLTRFEHLSADWLLTGRGEMLLRA